MIPTAVPTIASSATVLAVASTSVTAPTSNSSTSLIVMVNAWSVNEPSLLVARTVMFRVGPSGLSIDRAGHGHHTGVGVDGKPAAVVILQGVGDRVVGGVRIAGTGRDSHCGAHRRRFRPPHWRWHPRR